jgi:copper chaperone CopZ
MKQQDQGRFGQAVPSRDGLTSSAPRVAYLSVLGMGCARCLERVRNGLLAVDGVLMAKVDLAERQATVVYDPQRAAPPDLLRAIAAAGNDGRHRYVGEFLAHVPLEEVPYAWW